MSCKLKQGFLEGKRMGKASNRASTEIRNLKDQQFVRYSLLITETQIYSLNLIAQSTCKRPLNARNKLVQIIRLFRKMSWNPNQGPMAPGFFGPPPGVVNTVTTTTTKYVNPFHLQLIPINFDPSCKKCRGTGVVLKNGQPAPCKRCYKHCGYCRKCYGTRINYSTGQPCTYCLNGKYIYDKKMRKQLQKMNEYSSDSD